MGEDTTGISVRPARTEEASELARMMVDGLRSRLNDLGPYFATYLHRQFIRSDHALCLVAERDGQRVGYGVALVDRSAFFRGFLMRRGIPAALMVLPWLLHPRNIRTAISGLFYSRQAAETDPPAELVSLVVAPSARRTGVGSAITFAVIDALRERGIATLKVTTPPNNEAANALYKRYGFEYVRTERLYHDSKVNVYHYPVLRTD